MSNHHSLVCRERAIRRAARVGLMHRLACRAIAREFDLALPEQALVQYNRHAWTRADADARIARLTRQTDSERDNEQERSAAA